MAVFSVYMVVLTFEIFPGRAHVERGDVTPPTSQPRLSDHQSECQPPLPLTPTPPTPLVRSHSMIGVHAKAMI